MYLVYGVSSLAKLRYIVRVVVVHCRVVVPLCVLNVVSNTPLTHGASSSRCNLALLLI